MTDPSPDDMPKTEKTPIGNRSMSGLWKRLSTGIQLLVALGIAIGVLIFLILMPPMDRHDEHAPRPGRAQVVRVVEHGVIHVEPQSSLATKLVPFQVTREPITTPLMRVTGIVAASLRPSEQANGDQWQFNDPEALETFFEWRRAQLDIAFATDQLDRIKQLNEVRVAAQQQIVERTGRLVRAGTDSQADLEVARAELLELEIEGRQEQYEAESEIRIAHQTEAVLARRLELAGLDPGMFEVATADIDIIVADVPETYQAKVFVGQQCEARFFGLPGQVFPGVVRSISPVLSPERRSLRVLFFVDDPDDKLRPGMFAEIGLGTDPRDTILIPSESVIHIGLDDYVLVQDGGAASQWYVTPVEVFDSSEAMVEVISGLEVGQTIITRGAILLKPVATLSLNEQPTRNDMPSGEIMREGQP